MTASFTTPFNHELAPVPIDIEGPLCAALCLFYGAANVTRSLGKVVNHEKKATWIVVVIVCEVIARDLGEFSDVNYRRARRRPKRNLRLHSRAR